MASSIDPDRRPRPALSVAFILVLLAAMAGLAYALFRLPYDEAYVARTEDGLVEQLTPIFWAAAVFICLGLAIRYGWKRGYYGAWFFAALCLREMDFHTKFTEENINSIRYWKSGEEPLLQKVVVFILIVLTARAIWRFLKGGIGWLRAELRQRRAHAITTVGVLAFVGIAYLLDNVLDMDDLENPRTLFFSLFEETVELGIPVLICVALAQAARAGVLRGKVGGDEG